MKSQTIKKISRIPVLLAIVAAGLNSAELLAVYQPEGRAYVGWLAALAVSVALFVCVEGFLAHPSWVNGAAIAAFGLTEVSTQILHAAMVRADVVVMTPLLEYVMGYISPSVVVFVGLTLPVIVHYGFGSSNAASSDTAQLGHSITILADALNRSAVLVAPTSNGNGRKRTGKTQTVSSQLELPEISNEKEQE